MRAGLRRLLLVAGGLAVGLVASEILARSLPPAAGGEFFIRATDGSPTGLMRPDDTLGVDPVPGFRGTGRYAAGAVDVVLDRYGLRSPEPGPGDARWLVLGDSFTMALQVPWEATFAARLEPRVGARVLNGGVDGFSTWQAVERYRRLEPQVHPDVVGLVFFLGNDLSDNAHQQALGQPVTRVQQRPPSLATRILLGNSSLYRHLRVAWRRHTATAPDSPEWGRFRGELEIFSRSGTARLEGLAGPTRDALAAFRDATAARGDGAWVAIAPPAFAMTDAAAERTLGAFRLESPDVDAPRRALTEMLRGLGLTTCDLTDPLRAAEARGEAPYLRFDGHWSARGHQVVAETIARCLGAEEA